jgi:hypothetical protein
MQPTTNPTVPATSPLPAQAGKNQSTVPRQAPIPLPDELLRQIGGGLTPTTTW